MKRLIYLLLILPLLISCSSGENLNHDIPKDPEIPSSESLKGKSFYTFLRTDNDYKEIYDVYRVFTFTSDKDVIEYQAKGSPSGDTLYVSNKGKYSYSHPNLQIKISGNLSFDFIGKMNDKRDEFTYKYSEDKTYKFIIR